MATRSTKLPDYVPTVDPVVQVERMHQQKRLQELDQEIQERCYQEEIRFLQRHRGQYERQQAQVQRMHNLRPSSKAMELAECQMSIEIIDRLLTKLAHYKEQGGY